jgi:hypothetical protein
LWIDPPELTTSSFISFFIACRWPATFAVFQTVIRSRIPAKLAKKQEEFSKTLIDRTDQEACRAVADTSCHHFA